MVSKRSGGEDVSVLEEHEVERLSEFGIPRRTRKGHTGVHCEERNDLSSLRKTNLSSS